MTSRASAPRVVLAVGGNALTASGEPGSAEGILANAAAMAQAVGAVRATGAEVVVVHGNGPQVGNLAIQQESGAPGVPPQPLHQLNAMTQGQLGSVLAREIDRVCNATTAVAVVTHVEVDPADPAFADPTKPVGPFFTAAEAQRLAAERGWVVGEDAGRGYRRLVPSPMPRAVLERAAVRALVAAGFVVVAAGGGGIGVRRDDDGGWQGVDGVIDKDHAAALLAGDLGASALYLLTGVEALLLDFGTPDERPARRLSADQARELLASGQLAAGSMGPKVAAAVRFLESGGDTAVITSPDRLGAVLAGDPDTGTTITAVREVQEVGR